MSEVAAKVTPTGTLLHLSVDQIRPTPSNPRQLFDPAPLESLKESIKTHGVLVPITVYKLPGQDLYGIVDGERRFRCCKLLADEGTVVQIPANVVKAPDAMASLIYMFNIHSFREQWELMPTAIGLQRVIEHLGQPTDDEIQALTGLSQPQIRRCKLILSFPKHFQEMSLVDNPKERIPSNFWVELAPVLELAKMYSPMLIGQMGVDGITERLVEKYRKGKIRSVIHFRRIVEAFEVNAESPDGLERVADAFREYVLDVDLETRAIFDPLVAEPRRIATASGACDRFLTDMSKAKPEYIADEGERRRLIGQLQNIIGFSNDLIDRLSSFDPPSAE